ncbi:MAG TPA: hypothetical protein VLC73_00350 [Burkholderiales bacterium]|nr:hypothetical protein [Burkholderiales bacterium]
MSATTDDHANVAWVTVEVSLEPAALAAFCRDVERLYRINPYLEFRRWRETGPGAFAVALRNLSNQRDLELQLTLERSSERDFRVRYDRGVRRSTRFEIDATADGSRLRITDDYGGATEADTAEVDRSLHAWGVALREYLLRDRRWGWCAPWRWYMRRVWVPMKPSARRITFIILLVTLAEIALIALVMAIYWAEHRA